MNLLLTNKCNKNSLRENYNKFIENDRLILKSEQIFRSENHNIFTQKTNKVALIVSDHKII